MKNKLLILGGDLRIVYLANMLVEDNYCVGTYGMEEAQSLIDFSKINVYDNLENAINNSEIIISSIPLSQDGENVFCKYTDRQISIETLNKLLSGKIFIAGKVPNVLKLNNEIQIYDILENEEYAVLNAIATAEGAIQIAMEETLKTLNGSKILIMGFGRIGKILAKMLQGIGAKVYCEARKKSDLAYIEAYGYEPIDLKNLDKHLEQFDIIFNNIPTLILDKPKIDLLKADALIIDLASKPGGVDFEYAKQKNIKTIWALALPGKVAPISAANYIKNVVTNILNNERN